MNIMDMPSDHLQALRETVAKAVHGGLRLSSKETIAFAAELNTVAKMIREVEEENMVLNHALAARKDRLRDRKLDPDVTECAAVVPIRAPRALRVVTHDDGGNVA